MTIIRKSSSAVYVPGATAAADVLEAQRQERRQVAALKSASSLLHRVQPPNVSVLLPLMFTLKGNPLTLRDHFMFEPFFDTRMTQSLVLKCGRQVGKSLSLAVKGIITAAWLPYFNTVFVTPLFEMIRRFSVNYVHDLVHTSPVKNILINKASSQNVLQRSFRSGSLMHFTFAFQDCERTRGIFADAVCFDEVQDMDPAFIPIIRQTTSASDYDIAYHTGTPKTMNNTLQQLWEESSQAEWHIPCGRCHYENIPSLNYDLEKMTGPAHLTREISNESPGVICAKCSKPINPRIGRWIHHRPDLRSISVGRHVPQQILPGHYANPNRWRALLATRAGLGLAKPSDYANEICGESVDVGSRLVSMQELRAATRPRPNTLDYLREHRDDYVQRICSVDWSGGGAREISFTTIAAMGMKPDGTIDVVYGHRSPIPNDHIGESQLILDIMAVWQATHLVHDFNGAGAGRETLLKQAGYPANRIIPMVYLPAGRGPLMRHVPRNDQTGQRDYYQLDKARTLTQCCQLIKFQQITFFRTQGDTAAQSLLNDFLSLVEDMVDSRSGSDIFTIIRDKTAGPDDFAHSVNMGACALFWQRDKWPDLAALAGLEVDASLLHEIGHNSPDWDAWD